MAQDSSHFLNELPLWKLKKVAIECSIDVSDCIHKRDFVERIKARKLTEEQVRKALERAGDAGQDEEIESEIEEISRRPAEAGELPEREEKSAERDIEEAMRTRPAFFEIDSAAEAAINRMIIGDFKEAIRLNREARLKCIDSFSSYQVFSAAVSIRAADELLSRIPNEKGRLDPNLRTAVAAAKRAFLNGSPRQREEALENLETLATKAYAAFIADSEEEERELHELLLDYESFGTRTEEARRYLQIAASARQAFNLTEYRTYLGNARSLADQAKGMRAKEIENTFHLVRAAAAEAAELGALIPSFEAGIEEARRAFDAGKFRNAVELLAAVERATDSAHVERLRAERDLEARQAEKVQSTVIAYGPILNEAHAYGIDVREGLTHIENAKVALSRRDVVSAAKYARRVRELASAVDKDLDDKRIERGVIKHVQDAKCGKCGKRTLYQYPNAMQKCRECGHAFSTAYMPPPGAPVGTVYPQQYYVPPAQSQEQEERRRKGVLRQ